MPNSSLHISFADDAARALGHPLLTDYSGSYLLGSTAPDVRNLAGWDRYSTHFFDLANDEPGKGIQGLFETYPELADAANLGHETRAFVLGYMCHLVTDEHWIAGVYRPYFGKKTSADPLTNVLDRVLQFELDKRERNGIRDLDGVIEALKDSDTGVNVSFIDADLLRRWKDVMTERTSMDLGWDHLRRFVRKALPQHLKDDEGTMTSVIAQGPELLSRAKEQAPDHVIASFRAKAIDKFVDIAGEYLS